MMQVVKKTIPSEEVQLAWLAGIIDGEGTIGIYNRNKTKTHRVVNLTIVNSDEVILSKAKEIYEQYNIFASKYTHNNKNPVGFIARKPCYVLTVRRWDDFQKMIQLLIPYLIGNKKQVAEEALEYMKSHPKYFRKLNICKFCKTT